MKNRKNEDFRYYHKVYILCGQIGWFVGVGDNNVRKPT